MKLNKIVLGLLIVAAVVAIPLQISASAPNDDKNIVLTKDNLMILNSQVDGESVGALILKAKELDNNLSGKLHKKTPLYLFLNTPGGSIQSGLEFIEAMNGLGRPVNTVTLFAASMGFQIAQNLGERLILKNGILMSHHANGQIQGDFGGVSTQMDSRYKLWLDRIRELDEQTVKRTNGKQTYESYTKQYDHEMWDTGTKSVQEGYADKIVSVRCDKSLQGTTTHRAVFLGMSISYELDNCPINTKPLNVQVGMTVPATPEYVDNIKKQFLSNYEEKANKPLPMDF